MAKKKKESVLQGVFQLTTQEREYLDSFQEYINHRKISCRHLDGSDSTSSSSGDWETWWDLQDIFALMKFSIPNGEDSYKSNVRTGEIAGRLQTVIQKLSKVVVGFMVKSDDESMIFPNKIKELMLDNFFQRQRKTLMNAMFIALKNGTCPLTLNFVLRAGEKTFRKKAFKNAPKTKDGEVDAPYTSEKIKVMFVEKRDISLNIERLQNVFLDPDASDVRDDYSYVSRYYKYKILPLKKFRKIFTKQRGYSNLEYVKPVGKYADSELEGNRTWLKQPTHLSGDYVYVVEVKDVDDDKYMVFANDVPIKNCEIQEDHKELDIHLLRPRVIPGEIYGDGIPDSLIPVANAIEQIINQMNDNVAMSNNPAWAVEKAGYNEISKYYRKIRPGALVPVMNQNSMQVLKLPPMGVDVFQTLEVLRREATIASQIDPSQLALMSKKITATANLINKEIMDAFVGYVLENFFYTFVDIGRQYLSMVQQYLTQDEVETFISENDELVQIAKQKRMPIYDKKVTIDWDNQTLDVIDMPGEVSYVEVKKELFQREIETEVYDEKTKKSEKKTYKVWTRPKDHNLLITPESREIVSRALEAEAINAQFGMLMKLMVDPSNKAAVAQHPMPLINAVSFTEELFEKNRISKKHLLNPSYMMTEDIAYAQEQNKLMFDGQFVQPEAGMSKEHIEEHTKLEAAITQMLKSMQQEMDQQMMINPMQVDMEKEQSIMRLTEVLQRVGEHKMLDGMPGVAYADVQNASIAAQMPRQPQPQQGGMEGGQMMPGLASTAGSPEGGPGQIGGLANMMMPQ